MLTRSMLRSANVATPFTAVTVGWPARVPPPGLAASVTVTVPLKLVTVFPRASCTATWTAGVIAAPAAVFVGGTVNTSWLPAIATLKSAAVSAFPPNDAQGPARPVWSTARACQ